MRRRRSLQPVARGIATVAVVMLLLVASSLIVFFANRGLVFEQRTSANHLRAARALAAAESGLEWAIARLNDPRRIGADCTAGGTEAERLSFRDRYAPTAADGGIAPVTDARPGCRLGHTSPACSCPQGGQPSRLLGDAPSFTVDLAAVEGDVDALRISARGCTSAALDCVPGSTVEPADATAAVQSIVKRVPPWWAAPVAAVTAGGTVTVEAGVQLINTDAATQGLLVHAARAVAGAGLDAAERRLTTVPGSPPEAAVLRDDGTLLPPASARGTDGEDAFQRRFGQPLARFRDDPAVRVLSGCDAGDCTAQIAAAGVEGHAAFVVEGDLQLGPAASAPAVGSAARPVLLIVTGNLRGTVGAPWFGLIHTLGDAVVEGVDLQGALVAGGSLRLAGGARIAYAPTVLQRLSTQHGAFARLAGSWRDGRCTSDDPALPCVFIP